MAVAMYQMYPVLKVHLQILPPLLLKEVHWVGKGRQNHPVGKKKVLQDFSSHLSPGDAVKMQLEKEDV